MNRDFKGIWIPREIWLDSKLSMQAKALWAEIHSLNDRGAGGCYASDDYLMKFLGVKISRLHEVMKELRDAGLIEKVSFDGRNRVVKAIVPEVEYGGRQPSGKPEPCLPENRNPAFRKTGTPTIYRENTLENSIDKTPPNPLKGEGAGPSFSPSSAKNEQKKADPEKKQVREHVQLSDDEHAKLLSEYGESKLNQMLDVLDAYKGSTGKRYKSDYHTLLPAGWVHKRWLEEKDPAKSPAVAKHRQGSKLAFETEKDTWKPPETKAKEKTPEEKARIKKEFGVDL